MAWRHLGFLRIPTRFSPLLLYCSSYERHPQSVSNECYKFGVVGEKLNRVFRRGVTREVSSAAPRARHLCSSGHYNLWLRCVHKACSRLRCFRRALLDQTSFYWTGPLIATSQTDCPARSSAASSKHTSVTSLLLPSSIGISSVALKLPS